MNELPTGLFDKVVSGQQITISAQVWNAMLDAALANRYGGRPPQDFDQGRQPVGIIRIKNDSANDQPKYAILGLNTPLNLPSENLAEFKRAVVFSGITPVAGTHEGKFCVLQEPLAKGAIGAGMVMGVTPVQLTVSGALQKFAEITSTAASLTNGASGSVEVLWAEPSGSPRWANVRIGNLVVSSVAPLASYMGCQISPITLAAGASIQEALLTPTGTRPWVAAGPNVPTLGANYIQASVNGLYLITAATTILQWSGWAAGAPTSGRMRIEINTDGGSIPQELPVVTTDGVNEYFAITTFMQLQSGEKAYFKTYNETNKQIAVGERNGSLLVALFALT